MTSIVTRPRDALTRPGGVHRRRTRIKFEIYSHESPEPIDVSEDVYSITMSKNIKGVGTLQVQLTPSKNYANKIFPNDYLNVYFNTGDGQGWTRVFFGMVDRVQESYYVTQDGKPTTYYSLFCSDFQKALEMIHLYFNPHLTGRDDFTGESFGTVNIGGLALYAKGLLLTGSPPNIVRKLLYLIMGFGSQVQVPESLRQKINPDILESRRRRRVEFAADLVASDEVKKEISDAGGFYQYREKIRQEQDARLAIAEAQFQVTGEENLYRSELVNAPQRAGESTSYIARVVKTLRDQGRFDEANVFFQTGDDARQAQLEILTEQRLNEELFGSSTEGRDAEDERTYRAISQGASKEHPVTLLDLIDTFTFVEDNAIDGYMAKRPVISQMGPLFNIVMSYCNDVVNELFFDLRPLTIDENYRTRISKELTAGEWSRAADELYGNEYEGEVGITHVPAMVMREYPFSTFHKLPANNIPLSIASDSRKTLGVIYFGAIFSNRPNEAGRHIVTIPTINPERLVGGNADRVAKKHLDVAVLYETEIISSELGRSDHEIFNLHDFYSNWLIGENSKYYMQDILPLTIPVSIMRHGLRYKRTTTAFAAFLPEVTPIIFPEEELEEQEEAEEEEIVPSSLLGLPIQIGTVDFDFESPIVNSYGYVLVSGEEAEEIGGVPDDAQWVFNNGIDLFAIEGTPVYAIADGNVVGSLPNGALDNYGNTIVIEHPGLVVDGDKVVHSVYSHLQVRTVARDQNRRDLKAALSESLIDQGRFTPVPVNKGDLLGFVGRTAGTRRNRRRTLEVDKAKLHFELLVEHNEKVFPAVNDADTPVVASDNAAFATTTWGSGNNPRSLNPQTFYTDRGLNLLLFANGTTSASDVRSSSLISSNGFLDSEPAVRIRREPENAEEEIDRDIQEGNEPQQGRLVGSVDSSSVRAQLARWALLQDMWYQHNVEYMSGSIQVRGAPEIRVGYRLDLPDRNMSFYVEGVQHTWRFPDAMTTYVTVTRGQPSNPYPAYIPPRIGSFSNTRTQRGLGSRLSKFFLTPDPVAVRRGLVFRKKKPVADDTPLGTEVGSTGSSNFVDTRNFLDQNEERYFLAEVQDTAVPIQSGPDEPSAEEYESILEENVNQGLINTSLNRQVEGAENRESPFPAETEIGDFPGGGSGNVG